MNIRLLFLLILPLALASCVSQQKYNRAVDAQSRMNLLRQQYLAENNRLYAELDSMQRDTVFLAAVEEKDENTSAELEVKDELISKNVEMGQTRGAILNSTARLESTNPVITARMHEVMEQERMINVLADDLNTALSGFGAEEMNMRVETEGVYITLHESLLFNGTDLTINPRGKEALTQLGGVIKSNPNVSIRIEGHIDTPSANGNTSVDSWEMSTQRAIAVGRVLSKENGVAGNKLILAGRGDHLPLAGNQYPMARSLNRRVEIIMMPVISDGIGLDTLKRD